MQCILEPQQTGLQIYLTVIGTFQVSRPGSYDNEEVLDISPRYEVLDKIPGYEVLDTTQISRTGISLPDAV